MAAFRKDYASSKYNPPFSFELRIGTCYFFYRLVPAFISVLLQRSSHFKALYYLIFTVYLRYRISLALSETAYEVISHMSHLKILKKGKKSVIRQQNIFTDYSAIALNNSDINLKNSVKVSIL